MNIKISLYRVFYIVKAYLIEVNVEFGNFI